MVCEECGLQLPDDAARTHEGRWLCPAHKVLATMPKPVAPEGVDVMAVIDAVTQEFAIFKASQTAALKGYDERLDEVQARHDTGLQTLQSDLVTRFKQVKGHEQRLMTAETSLGAARDVLGEAATRGDVVAQIGVLTQEIVGLKVTYQGLLSYIQSAHDNHQLLAARVSEVSAGLSAHTGLSIWQRLYWLVRGTR